MSSFDYRDQFPITQGMRDGTEKELSLTEFEMELRINVLLWRKQKNPVYGIEALLSCLLVHRPIPRDLQNWLFEAIQKSHDTRGSTTIDEALQIRRKETEQYNAYNGHRIAIERPNCVYYMALLEYVTGNKNVSLRANLVVIREQPSFGAETLEKYYREDKPEIEIDVSFIQDTNTKIAFLSSFKHSSLSDRECRFLQNSIDQIRAE